MPTLTVTAADGATNAIEVTEASGRDEVLFVVPAMGVDARYYAPLCDAFAARGFTTAVTDLRGLGASSIRPRRGTDFGYRQIVELDYPAYLSALRGHVGDRPIHLLGHSLGGQLATLHLARQPDSLAGLILVASCTVYWRNWGPWRGRMLYALASGYALAARTLGYFPGKRLGFGGTEAKTVMRDWAHKARTGEYAPRGATFDYEARLREVTCPILGLTIEGDNWAPPAALRHLLDKMPSADVTQRVVGPDPAHALDHFRWARYPKVVTEAVEEWIDCVGQKVNSERSVV